MTTGEKEARILSLSFSVIFFFFSEREMGRITGIALKLDLTLTTPISICHGCQCIIIDDFSIRKQRLKDL